MKSKRIKQKALIFAVIFAMVAFVSGESTSATTVLVPDDYATIQEAVDAANAGDTIIVRDGTYRENIDVKKRLTLKSENIWNSTEKITYTYNGSTYSNSLGNYWADYTGNDTNDDEIGETPYRINSDEDNYPLMLPWQNYIPEETRAAENKNEET